jgi:anaerobic magnesium-protoporphyrin IX monomethyl ester cyclase
VTVLVANAPTVLPAPGGRERYFVKAGSRWPFSIEKRRGDACRYVPFPFALAYTAALLERARIPVEVLDGVALNLDVEAFTERAAALRPSIVLLEATTPTIATDLEVAAALKARTGAVVALAGAHATVFAERLLREQPAVDWVIRGEYELAAVAAIEAHRAGGDVAAVPGIVQGAGEGPHRTVRVGPPPQPIADLDVLPMPARHLFPSRDAASLWPYWDGFCQRRPSAQMHSSRGCPFRCTFCLWVSVMYGQGRYRTFSPRRVVDEMEELVRAHGAREIYFDDDTFTACEDHVLGVCDELRTRGLRVPWSVMGDAMAITRRAVDAMAGAGCVGMKFGVESADAEVLRRARKPVKPDRVLEVAAWCAERRLKTHATVTFGLDGDTPETMERTLRWACALPVDSIQFSVATPFPGTEQFRLAEEAGRIVDAPWSEWDGARASVLRFEGMRSEDVSEFARAAAGRWIRARLRDPAWCRRQARFAWQIARDQGVAGVARRIRRGVALLAGQRA